MDWKLSQPRAALFVCTYRVRYVVFNYLGVMSSVKLLSKLLLNSLQRLLLRSLLSHAIYL